MIPNIKTGSGAVGAMKYLMQGPKDNQNEERVAWTQTRHLPTEDPYLAAKLMYNEAEYARQQLGSRIEKNILSASFSLPVGEKLSPEEWQEAIDFIAKHERIGLDGHSALIVAHNDTEHDHVHVIWSRLDENGKAWRDTQYKRRFREACTDLEIKKGLRIVTHDREGEERKPPSIEENKQAKRRQTKAREKFSDKEIETVAGATRGHFHEAESWEDLQGRLAQHGVELQAKGPGLVLTNGEQEMKLSEIDKNIRRSSPKRKLKRDTSKDVYLEEKFGQTWDEYSGKELVPETAKDKKKSRKKYPSKSKRSPEKKARQGKALKTASDASQKRSGKKDSLASEKQKEPLRAALQPDKANSGAEGKGDTYLTPFEIIDKDNRKVAQPLANRSTLQADLPHHNLPPEKLPDEVFSAEEIEGWRKKLKYGLLHSSGWQGMSNLARLHGLTIAYGYAMHDHTKHFRLNQIDERFTYAYFVERFGESWGQYRYNKEEIKRKLKERKSRDDRDPGHDPQL